jgi:hypothetical protein
VRRRRGGTAARRHGGTAARRHGGTAVARTIRSIQGVFMKKLAALSLALVAGAASASAIDIQTGTYTGGTNSTTTAADFQSIVEGVVGAPTSVSSYDNLAAAINDGALEATITFDVTSPDTWYFRAGVDFGKGGAMFLDGAQVLDSKNTNMWWNYSYTDATQYLAGSAALSVGVHTLTLYGLEDCCSGNQQAQFRIGDDGTFTSFSNTDGLPAIPEAQNYAMLLAGLGLVATLARRRKQA